MAIKLRHHAMIKLENKDVMPEAAYHATLQAATVLSVLFPLFIYIFAQKYFLQGINVSASVKG